ncbi:NAD(P)/FAD-dependent oxidoreductase [Vulcanisaeta thermophila]|uniref:NAD(P)/FAD-dependent oxidoreductase n=1 Tax=Vulcanisaeta thermophila TaxID=867917 RepID=UPI000853625F|nr:FAD-dependent oxidoreductase [Vulcanisaeta thermophila]
MVKKVVILGGGTGGALLANKLPRDEFEVTIVDKQEYHHFLPALLYIAFRGYRKPIKRGIKTLLKPWVNFIPSGARAVNLYDRYVELENGKRLNYDYLVIATGATMDYSKVPGLDKVVEQFGNYHSTEENAWKVWNSLNSMGSGTLVIGLTYERYRCPPSPLEGVFLAEEYFRMRGIRDKVRIVYITFYPKPYPAEGINEIVEPLLKERGIEYLTLFMVDHVDPEKRVIYFMEGEEIKYDVFIPIPPHAGADIKYTPEDVLDSDRFVKADKFTNRVQGFDDAFVIGDASALPVAKTGVTAHLQADVVAKLLMGETAANTGRTHCPFDVGYGLGTFVISDFRNPALRFPVGKLPHLFKVAFMASYWDMILYPELWDPIFNAYFSATEPSKLRVFYG